MNKEKIFRVLTLIFMIITFIGAGYVLFNKGQVQHQVTWFDQSFKSIYADNRNSCSEVFKRNKVNHYILRSRLAHLFPF